MVKTTTVNQFKAALQTFNLLYYIVYNKYTKSLLSMYLDIR